jgi:hypothetical protein
LLLFFLLNTRLRHLKLQDMSLSEPIPLMELISFPIVKSLEHFELDIDSCWCSDVELNSPCVSGLQFQFQTLKLEGQLLSFEIGQFFVLEFCLSLSNPISVSTIIPTTTHHLASFSVESLAIGLFESQELISGRSLTDCALLLEAFPNLTSCSVEFIQTEKFIFDLFISILRTCQNMNECLNALSNHESTDDLRLTRKRKRIQ